MASLEGIIPAETSGFTMGVEHWEEFEGVLNKGEVDADD